MSCAGPAWIAVYLRVDSVTARSSKRQVHRALLRLGSLARLGSIIRGHRYAPNATGGMRSATIAEASGPALPSRIDVPERAPMDINERCGMCCA